jgi:2-hydroxy-3-oxopropionate reductase
MENVPSDVLFLGTGIMGAPMARRLAEAGLHVEAWNRTDHKTAALRQYGVFPLLDLQSIAVKKRTVVVMLSSGDVVDEALFGSCAGRPASEVLAPGSVVIVMSSIPVEQARRQAERLLRNDIRYVDAPVSGGEKGAVNGSLSIMIGGPSELCVALMPILNPLGKVTRVGDVGCGQLAKLVNQLIVGISIGAVAEALVMAELGGADLTAVVAALQGGFADSAVLRQHGQRMINSDYRPGAHCTTQLKDLTTAQAMGQRLGGSFPLLSLCTKLYEQLCESNRRALDHSALYLDARDRGGLPSEEPADSYHRNDL